MGYLEFFLRCRPPCRSLLAIIFVVILAGSIDIDCKDLTSRFANDVIASCAFGLKVDSLTDEKNKFHEKVQEASGVHLRQILMFFIMSTCPFIAKVSFYSQHYHLSDFRNRLLDRGLNFFILIYPASFLIY